MRGKVWNEWIPSFHSGLNDFVFAVAAFLGQVHLLRWALGLDESRPLRPLRRRDARGKTYHGVMEEQLPGVDQFLVQQHVEEVVDEITCREETTTSNAEGRERLGRNWTDLVDNGRR